MQLAMLLLMILGLFVQGILTNEARHILRLNDDSPCVATSLRPGDGSVDIRPAVAAAQYAPSSELTVTAPSEACDCEESRPLDGAVNNIRASHLRSSANGPALKHPGRITLDTDD